MNLDPQKFFIGLMDFFSILLPGALLTWLLMDDVGPVILESRYAALSGAQGWAAFLFASYLFGHFVFLLGSWLDELYEPARDNTLDAQIKLLARRDRLLRWPIRVLIWLVFKADRNLAFAKALQIRRRSLSSLQANDAINTFQWSKALLAIESPASLSAIQRLEADSKFFRCFTIVLLILLVAWLSQHRWANFAFALWLLPFALWRYMEQRFKATRQAYWSVITITSRDAKVVLEWPESNLPDPTHAGGVVFRQRGRNAEYLLVEAKDDPSQWVLPKGHVEAGEQHREAAVREVHEETGVWARIAHAHHLRDASYSLDGAIVTTRFFLMQSKGRGLRKDKDRKHLWLPLVEAVAKASHIETRELLIETRELLQAAELLRSISRTRI